MRQVNPDIRHVYCNVACRCLLHLHKSNARPHTPHTRRQLRCAVETNILYLHLLHRRYHRTFLSGWVQYANSQDQSQIQRRRPHSFFRETRGTFLPEWRCPWKCQKDLSQRGLFQSHWLHTCYLVFVLTPVTRNENIIQLGNSILTSIKVPHKGDRTHFFRHEDSQSRHLLNNLMLVFRN